MLVNDEQIIAVRRELWAQHRILVEHGAATGFAALAQESGDVARSGYGYAAQQGEWIAVVLCGANTSATDL